MPSFLSNNTNQCCCEEMRCCPPRTLRVTTSGWAGTGVGGWVHAGDTYELDIGAHTDFYPNTGCGQPYDGTNYTLFPSAIFPQRYPSTDLTGPNPHLCYYGFGASQTAAPYASGWETVLGPCESIPKCCSAPGGGAIVYGPYGSGCNAWGRISLDDHNGAYICHRYYRGMRPEMRANVKRTGGRTGEEAVLMFDVYCRRLWGSSPLCNDDIIKALPCGIEDGFVPADAPQGKWYCIDYRCGPRNEDPMMRADDPDWVWDCEQFKCSATQHEGIVKPHLFPYHDAGNQSATIKIKLEVERHYVPTDKNYGAAKRALPKSWIVVGAEVKEPGSGYEVGEFFTVFYDDVWMQTLSDYRGESFYTLPAWDWECGIFPLTWKDEYDLEPVKDELGEDAYWPQRLRIEEVDDDGGIVSLSVVAWLATPEFKPGPCIEEITDRKKKKKFFPAFARVICHPNSVAIGGTGYEVDDAIEFIPISPGVVTHAAATAKVVDVDEDGAVLDWEIQGSDIWRYHMGGPLDARTFFTPQDPVGRWPQCPEWVTYDPKKDKRGAYKWDDKVELCTLSWTGIGVPVRGASLAVYCGGQTPGVTGGRSMMESSCSLTGATVTITRPECRTSINVTTYFPWLDYKYESQQFIEELESLSPPFLNTLLNKYRPYPRCTGGGAQITPVITNGANESLIGGSLSSASVATRGDFYAFVDKDHEQPILAPFSVPSSGVVASFTRTVAMIEGSDAVVCDTLGGDGSVVIVPGMSVRGEGIPAGAVVLGVEGQSVTLNRPAMISKNVDNVIFESLAAGSGSGAVIEQFGMSAVLNFPQENYAASEKLVPTATRFAYWRVTSATIDPDARGAGYEVGFEFDVYPDKGTEFTHAWKQTGGDDPDVNPNGSWYPDQVLDVATGRVPWPDDLASENPPPTRFYRGKCRLRVTAVNGTGGITGLLVVEPGLMFRAVWGAGLVHPDVDVRINSSTGFGAKAKITVETNKTSENFGKVMGCSIVQLPVSEAYDPVHSKPGQPPVPFPVGGRDYANPPSGYMWELIVSAHGAAMLAGQDYHQLGFFNPFHPNDTTMNLVGGSHPPYVRRAERCTLDECYHSLINGKTYRLFKTWSPKYWGSNNFGGGGGVMVSGYIENPGCLPEPNSYHPFPSSRYLPGTPITPHGVYRKKGEWDAGGWGGDVRMPPDTNEPCDENNYQLYEVKYPKFAGPRDYLVVEHGYYATVSVESGNTGNIRYGTGCEFDHDDGRTNYEP